MHAPSLEPEQREATQKIASKLESDCSRRDRLAFGCVGPRNYRSEEFLLNMRMSPCMAAIFVGEVVDSERRFMREVR